MIWVIGIGAFVAGMYLGAFCICALHLSKCGDE